MRLPKCRSDRARRIISLWLLFAIFASAASLSYFAYSVTSGIRFLGKEGVVWQQRGYDCGPAALQMIFSHFKIASDYQELTRRLAPASGGTSMLLLKRAAEAKGLRCGCWRLRACDLPEIPLPAILFVRRNHFVVLDSYDPTGTFLIRDPSRGRLELTARRLGSVWEGEAILFSRPEAGSDIASRWFVP